MKDAIETLVQSAYEGLVPSPEIERELIGSLSHERARPGRAGPGRALAAAAVLVAGLAVALAWQRSTRPPAGGLEDGEKAAALELPVITRPKTGVAPAIDADWISVGRGGRVRIFDERVNRWLSVSLDRLAAALKRSAAQFGKWREVSPGVRASRLPVVLRVDRETPWRHVKWVMTVCAEQKIANLSFAVQAPGTGRVYRLAAPLPVDLGVRPLRPVVEEELTEIKVLVQLSGNKEREVERGGVKVFVPTRYVYRFSDTETRELSVVAAWLENARRAVKGVPNCTLVGELKAGDKTAFFKVARLLAEFRRRGYERVHFYGTALPGAGTRKAKTLPYPRSNWPGEADPKRTRSSEAKPKRTR